MRGALDATKTGGVLRAGPGALRAGPGVWLDTSGSVCTLGTARRVAELIAAP